MAEESATTSLATLWWVMDRGDQQERRRVILVLSASVVADFLIVYAQYTALDHQRHGESYGAELMLYLASVTLWMWCDYWRIRRGATALGAWMRAMSDRIVERVRDVSIRDLEGLQPNTILLALTTDAQRVVNSVYAVTGAPRQVLRFFIAVLFGLTHSLAACLLATVTLMVLASTSTVQLRVLSAAFGRAAVVDRVLLSTFQDYLKGVKQIKLHAPRAAGLFGVVIEASTLLRQIRTELFAAYFSREHFMFAVLYGLLGLNVFVLPLVLPENSVDVREINLVLLWVIGSVFRLTAVLPEISEAATAVERIQKVDAQLRAERFDWLSDQGTPRAVLNPQSVGLRGVTFSYAHAGQGTQIGPLDLDVRRGQITFFVGPNGSGKSTAMRILCGLYPALSGQLLVDDQPLIRAELKTFRELFGVIFTDHRLLGSNDTLLADPRAAVLLEEVGLKGVLRAGVALGHGLSTGQQKRVALVQLLLQDRSILLFDEWAAEQDPEFREYFYRRLLPRLRDSGKFVVAVSHDEEYFDVADRCIQFSTGQVIAS